jgi:hypothetical protein
MKSKTPGLTKYVIGLSVLGAFVLVLLVLVLVKASASKADNLTYKAASQISNDLNDYVTKNNAIPDSLDKATKVSVPSTVTYTKKSDSKFEFCVTYKSSNIDVSATSAETSFLSGSFSASTSSSKTSSYLYISSDHKAGKQCQTIEPYIVNDGGTSIFNDGCSYDPNGGSQAADNYFACEERLSSPTSTPDGSQSI